MPAGPILIVDDNEANLKVARLALEAEGFDVRVADNGEDALELLRTLRPVLILMDIQLPGLDGLEVTRRLKADPATRDIAIVAVTAYAMKGDREKALQAGCDGYIAKPIDPIQLPQQLQDYLGSTGETAPPAPPAPPAPEPATRPDPAQIDVIAPPDGEPAILVVEDNPASRRMFRIALETAGHRVVEAQDATSALDLVARWRPAMIIQDLVLPDMDGLALVRRLSAQLGEPAVPIVCVSGFLSRLDELRAMEAGFAHVLTKPVDPSQLLDVVRIHLRVPPAWSSAGEGRCIVVVDDDPLQRRLAELWFASAGFEVLTAEDGVAGLEIVRRARPAVVVSDVLMPRMDGYALCIAIRHDAELGHIPVILNSSAYVEAADHALAARIGASALHGKTEGLEAVMRSVAAALRAPPPASPGEPVDVLEGEHAQRALWQLERQVQHNARLLQRTNLQQAQLTVLASVAESLARDRVIDGVLGHVLAACLDMAGISKGVLYTLDAGQLVLTHQIGFADADAPRLRAMFGCEALFLQVSRGGAVLLVPSPAVSVELSHRLIVETGAPTLLLAPVAWGEATYGVVLLGARTADMTGDDALAFARVLGVQMGQAIALAHSFTSLAASELRYRTLTENANDAICILTPGGVIREANRRLAALVGRPADELVGRALAEFVAPGRAHEDAYGDGDARAAPDELRAADGSVVLMAFSRTPMEVSGERLVFAIGRDVTTQVQAQRRRAQLEDEQRRTREQLLRSELEATEARAARQVAESRAALAEELERRNQELEAFSYSVSHDLRAPLRSIAGFSHVLLEDHADVLPAEAQEHLQRICASAQRMGDVIDDLLKLSRVTLAELARERASLSGIASAVVDELRRRDPARRVAVGIQGDLLVDADRGLLRVLLENLIGNAWKFTARTAQARIEVGAARDGERGPAYFVRDNGAGFDMASADKLFTPFHRLHTAEDFPGTGIGLATVHRIVERHGGRVWAVGAVGQGATVFFTLQPGPAVAAAD